MIEDVLMSIATLLPSAPSVGVIPSDQLPLPYLCSGLGAPILGKFTGSLGAITMPLNYSALFIGAMLSNSLLHGIDLPVDHALLQPLLVSMAGMLVGAFCMMWWLRDDNAHA